MLQDVVSIQAGSGNIETCLHAYLLMRLCFLHGREKNHEIAKNNPDAVYPYTFPDQVHALFEYEKIMVGIATDMYQTLNKVIIGLFSLVDGRHFNALTKKAICMSPSLWGRIQGLEDELGHPDEILLQGFQNDVYWYKNHHIKCYAIEEDAWAGLHKFKQKILFTPFEYSLETKILPKINPLLYPNFLKPYFVLSHPMVVFAPLPAFLDNQLCVDQDKESIEIPEISEALKVESQTFIQNAEIHLPDSQVLDDHVKIDFPKILARVTPSDVLIDKASGGIAVVKKQAESKIRVFKMANKHRKTLEDIFDYRSLNAVQYDKFKALWEHIGGEIPDSKSGGSHRVALWQGKKIEGIFVPHGDIVTVSVQ